MPTSAVKAVCHMTSVSSRRHRPHRAINSLGSSKHAVPRAYCNLSSLTTHELPNMTTAQISQSQQEDPCIGEVWCAVSQGNIGSANKRGHPDVALLLKEWEKLKIKESVLYRISKPPNKPLRQQLLLPEKFRKTVLQSLHDQCGHLGVDKTYGLVRERFYWPRMKTEIEAYCKKMCKMYTKKDNTTNCC